ncbi:septal ring lytic transglycosylase RlpA family protein [Spirosoma endbachense]|uniref:Probable endolytic peptidoglycan transglycosylase RlpA n=1 Tax=Spirosoma endbachense TaxID=2666025 RepID=A0A6P1VVY8_9BACT|nr:septal ring lytic transglycosylase RlpA family protein [Spirosoma endbachense]QHV96252.1 septal ring lytic transglycosylase RlpA family protein [Spirosoma endbachense]
MSYIMSLMLFFSNIKSAEALPSLIQKGKASFYSKKFNGRKTAYGERVSALALEGAHRSLPLNTLVEVTNLDNHRSVIVRINDRGPFSRSRVIDLTHAAAQALGMVSKGVANVSLRVVGKGQALAALVPSSPFNTPDAFQPLLEPVL